MRLSTKCYLILFLLLLVHPPLWAQGTNTNSVPYTVTIPSFTIPVPTQWAAWLTAHAVLLWFIVRFAIKALAKYAGSNQFVDGLLWALEHISLQKQVLPLADRAALRGPPPDSTASTEGAVTAKTPDGLSNTAPAQSNVANQVTTGAKTV
jgi:hypothetical protein